ncbi:hypothetical protein [uncultured Desulfuromusa sp.]|uniref:hypothetical protein n=1 Tax=uncultured Desulfuromusa sp. TaxID=219183 RepID=UPI002AA6701D|nr:hypothetical protein [uncultured Desulfuromusa sp.]
MKFILFLRVAEIFISGARKSAQLTEEIYFSGQKVVVPVIDSQLEFVSIEKALMSDAFPSKRLGANCSRLSGP